MNILAILGQLGRAVVSWGLGGSEDAEPIPCPEVTVQSARHTVVDAQAARHTTVDVGTC